MSSLPQWEYRTCTPSTYQMTILIVLESPPHGGSPRTNELVTWWTLLWIVFQPAIFFSHTLGFFLFYFAFGTTNFMSSPRFGVPGILVYFGAVFFLDEADGFANKTEASNVESICFSKDCGNRATINSRKMEVVPIRIWNYRFNNQIVQTRSDNPWSLQRRS